MSTRALGPGAGWGWLKEGINLGRHNPRAIFGAVALMALVALVPSLIQLALGQLGLGQQALLAAMGLTVVLAIVLYPLLIGGVLRVIDASEHGRPTRATAIFDTFRPGHDAGRLIGFGVLITAVYIVMFVAVVRLVGKDFFAWYWQMISAAQSGQTLDPAAMALPDGFGQVMALGSVIALFLGGVYAIGYGQVALAGRGVFAALGDGVAGTLKNLLPIVLLAVCAFVLMVALMVAFGLLAGLLALLGTLVHEMLGLALLIPLYIALLLVLYVVMFGVMYHLWRDVCAGGAPARDDEVAA